LKEALRRAYLAWIAPDSEAPRVMEMIIAALGESKGAVLDVGCGYGRYLRRMTESGIDATGVDMNADIVRSNRSRGLKSMTPEEYRASGAQPRVILMAHVIEHFAPRDLIEFIDGWLDTMPEAGELVIVTPLMSPHFYDDFDHVKPYHPGGIQMVFGGSGAQVQYWSRHRLVLVDVNFRRTPWRATLARGVYVGGAAGWPFHAANAVAALAFRLSAGLIGRKTGWLGRFRKVSRESAAGSSSN